MKNIAPALCAALLVTACASGPGYGPGYGTRPGHTPTPPVTTNPEPQQVSPLARSVTYRCEDLSTVVMTEGTGNVRVTMNSGLVLQLARRPAPGGFSYGDQRHEFRGAGDNAMWYVGDKQFRCRMQ